MRKSDLEKINKNFQKFFNRCKKANKLLRVLAVLEQEDVISKYLLPFDPLILTAQDRDRIEFAAIFISASNREEIERIVREKLKTAITALEKAGLTVLVRTPGHIGEIYSYLGIDLK